MIKDNSSYMSDLDKIFVENLNNMIAIKNVAIKDLEARSGVARVHLFGIRSGKHALSLYTVDRLCRALHVDPSLMIQSPKSNKKPEGTSKEVKRCTKCGSIEGSATCRASHG